MSDENSISLIELLSSSERDIAENYLEIADRLCSVGIEELQSTAIVQHEHTALLVASSDPTVRTWSSYNVQQFGINETSGRAALDRVLHKITLINNDSDEESLFGVDVEYDRVPLTENKSTLLKSLAIILFNCNDLKLNSSFVSEITAHCKSLINSEDICCTLELLPTILIIYCFILNDEVTVSLSDICRSNFFLDLVREDGRLQESLIAVLSMRTSVRIDFDVKKIINQLKPQQDTNLTTASRSVMNDLGVDDMIRFWESEEYKKYQKGCLSIVIHEDALLKSSSKEVKLAETLQQSLNSIVNSVLSWANILSEIYQSERDRKPIPTHNSDDVNISVGLFYLLIVVKSSWSTFDIHTKQLLASKLPVISILDCEAINVFLTYTRLRKRLSTNLSDEPLERLKKIVDAIDSFCDVVLNDEDLKENSLNSMVAFSFSMSPQYKKSHATASLYKDLENTSGADRWVSVLRSCLTHDVKMSIFGRVLSAVLTLNRQQDYACHQQVIEACHRCLPVWIRLGIKYSTICSTATLLLKRLVSEIELGGSTNFITSSLTGSSPWTHAMIRSVASLDSISDRLLWSQFVSDCKKNQIFSKDNSSYQLLQRVLKRDEKAREAIRVRQSQKQSEIQLEQCSQIDSTKPTTQTQEIFKATYTQQQQQSDKTFEDAKDEEIFKATSTYEKQQQLPLSQPRILNPTDITVVDLRDPTGGDTQEYPIDVDDNILEVPSRTIIDIDGGRVPEIKMSTPTKPTLTRNDLEQILDKSPYNTLSLKGNGAAEYLAESQHKYKCLTPPQLGDKMDKVKDKTPPSSPGVHKRQQVETPDAEAFLSRCRDRYESGTYRSSVLRNGGRSSPLRYSDTTETNSSKKLFQLSNLYKADDDLQAAMNEGRQPPPPPPEPPAEFITRARQREQPGGFQSAKTVQNMSHNFINRSKDLSLAPPQLYPKTPNELVSGFYNGTKSNVVRPKLHEMLREERPKQRGSELFKKKEVEVFKTPPRNIISQSLDSSPAAYSLAMLDDGSDNESLSQSVSFVDLANTVLSQSTPPQPPKQSPPLKRKPVIENHIQQMARSNSTTAINFERQPGGAVLVNHERLISRPIKIAELSPDSNNKSTYYSEALLAGDRKYVEKEKQRNRERILAQRETRLRSQKMNLLKALLELQLPKCRYICDGIPTSFKDEDEYARIFWNYIVDEGVTSVKQAVEEMVQSTSHSKSKGYDAGVVAETVIDKCEIVIEFTDGCSYYNESDLIAMSSPAWNKSQNSTSVVIGKVNRFYRRCKQILVRLQQSRCTSIAFGSSVLVRPLVKVSTIFRQNWALNHIATTSLYTQLISANPSDSIITSLVNPPKGFRAYLNRKFNSGQINAIIRAASLKSGFAIIQGPPGTGKTHCVTGLVGLLLMEHKKLLLVAPSNTACDEMSLRISRSGIRNSKGEQWYPKLMRVGVRDKVNEKLLPLYIEDILDKRLKQNVSSTNVINNLNKVHDNIRKEMQELTKKINQSKATDPAAASRYQESLRLLAARSKQEDWNRRKISLQQDEDRARVRNQILGEADIICSTIGSCKDIPTHFSAVIIDEAAQSVEPDVLLPLLFGAKVCVLVGDDKQLPATVLSHTAAQRGYTQSLFARLRKGGYVPHMLTTQYRMHPEIARFPNAEFYNNKLVTSNEVLVRPYDFTPFFVINIDSSVAKKSASFAPTSAGQCAPSSKSLSNPSEANAIKLLVSKLKTEFSNKNSGEPLTDNSFGIITPYKDQARLLRNKFNNQIEVGTVDGYQGREKKIILISMVRGPGVGGIGFTGLAERLNVMLTRGQSVVGIVCHVQTMSASPLWKRLFDNSRQRGILYDDISIFCGQKIPSAPRLDLSPELKVIAAKNAASRHSSCREKRSAESPPPAKKVQKTIPPPVLPKLRSTGGLTTGFVPQQSSRVKGRKVMTMEQVSRAQVPSDRYRKLPSRKT